MLYKEKVKIMAGTRNLAAEDLRDVRKKAKAEGQEKIRKKG